LSCAKLAVAALSARVAIRGKLIVERMEMVREGWVGLNTGREETDL
jgi:hypothetical protein